MSLALRFPSSQYFLRLLAYLLRILLTNMHYSHFWEWFVKLNEEISISDCGGWEATLWKSHAFPSQVEAKLVDKV